MKKQIILELNPQDEFFLKLKKNLINKSEFGMGHMIEPTIDNVIMAIFKTLKDVAKEQGQPASGKVKLNFSSKENIHPDFYPAMENNIDKSLNQRVHTETLEEYVDLIVKFMNEVADKQLEDKKIKVPKLVDSDFELKTITNYITSTWDGFDKVDAQAFFAKAWELSVDKTKNQFDEYAFTGLVEAWREEREDYSNWKAASSKIDEKELPLKLYDDEIAKIPMNILIGSMTLNKFVRNNWDYEKVVTQIVSQLKEDFPNASRLKPKGWLNLSKTYSDFDGMADFDKTKARKDFGGMDSGTAGSPSFEVRVSLPSVIYDDKCQGRKSLETLVGAILGHAYIMNERNNASKMLNELLELKKEYDKPKYFKEIVTEINPQFKEPITKALFACFKKNVDIDRELKSILGIEESKKVSKKRI